MATPFRRVPPLAVAFRPKLQDHRLERGQLPVVRWTEYSGNASAALMVAHALISLRGARPNSAAKVSREPVEKTDSLNLLLSEIRACRLCEAHLPHGPRPVLHVSPTAKLCIVSQAPGLRVHQTGLSFNDASGDRLREWMGVERATFYDASRIAIAAMAFCFPGYNAQGHDLPPRRECAATWRERLFATLPQFETTLLVGSYAQTWHLRNRAKLTMTETVRAWREYAPRYIPLPHPSWRNSGWLKKNSWFAEDLLPYLQRRVRRVLAY